MGRTSLQVATEEDFRELVPWLIGMSQSPERQCLHTCSGEGPSELRERPLGYLADGDLLYCIAVRDGRLAGPRSLYESAGFRLQFTGTGLRKYLERSRG